MNQLGVFSLVAVAIAGIFTADLMAPLGIAVQLFDDTENPSISGLSARGMSQRVVTASARTKPPVLSRDIPTGVRGVMVSRIFTRAFS